MVKGVLLLEAHDLKPSFPKSILDVRDLSGAEQSTLNGDDAALVVTSGKGKVGTVINGKDTVNNDAATASANKDESAGGTSQDVNSAASSQPEGLAAKGSAASGTASAVGTAAGAAGSAVGTAGAVGGSASTKDEALDEKSKAELGASSENDEDSAHISYESVSASIQEEAQESEQTSKGGFFSRLFGLDQKVEAPVPVVGTEPASPSTSNEKENAEDEFNFSEAVLRELNEEDSSLCKPRSFASMQWRAKSAMRELLKRKFDNVMLLSSSSLVDTFELTTELIAEVGDFKPTIAIAPSKLELFGSDKEAGLLMAAPGMGSGRFNIVVMPCAHLMDHPKWLNMISAALINNSQLKLILVGDASETAGLSMMWPHLDRAIRADIVLEFPAQGAMATLGSLISHYQQKLHLALKGLEAKRSSSKGFEKASAHGGDYLLADDIHKLAESVQAAESRKEREFGELFVTEDLVDDEILLPFSRDALELLACYCSRISGDRRYIAVSELNLKSLIFAANSYAIAEFGFDKALKTFFNDGKCAVVRRYHVLKALAQQDFRNNFLAESSLRDHRDRQLLICTSGFVVGQINGLSVIETLGTSYEYGEPVRITATIHAGGEGDVIDIERKAELAGQIHAKAMMIINGFLTKEFGAQQPLPVSASLVFEQSYSEVDGDSASLTGLCAVLSGLSGLPIRQDLAVTGAVDQFGDVQAVGGVNEKIEGFYRVCRLHGFTGTQGVIIPSSCVNQLVLRPAVVRAVRDGKFHIFTVNHVSDAMRILTAVEWGHAEIPGTICNRIAERVSNVDDGEENAGFIDRCMEFCTDLYQKITGRNSNQQ